LLFFFALSPVSFAALSNNSIKLSIQYNCEDGITTRIRKRRIFIFTSLFLALIAIASTGIITRNYEYASLGFPAAIITLIVFKFKTAYFVVTQTKGEFHYIRGAHQSLLDALPYLPISP
jgi:hypothetical protein